MCLVFFMPGGDLEYFYIPWEITWILSFAVWLGLFGWACQLRFFYVFSPSFSFFLYWAVGLVWLRLSSEASLLCLFGWAFLFSFFVPLRLGPSYVVGLLLLFFFFLPLFSPPRRGPSSSVELLLFSPPFGWAVINLGPRILKPLAIKHQICHSLQSTYEKQKTNWHNFS